jgi:hypothetical protein
MFVTIAMRCDLVACCGDHARELLTFIGHPAKHEKGSAGVGRLENFQHSHRVPFDPQLAPLPCFAREHIPHIVGMEPVLDVD